MATCNGDESTRKPKPTNFDIETPASERLRVLLIDDEPTVLHVMRRVLEREYDVTAVGSALELEAVIEGQQPYDAVLCDFGITAADGTEVSISLLQRWPQRAARLAVLTGNPFSERVIAFARTEVVRLIAKPIDVRSLFALVEELASSDD